MYVNEAASVVCQMTGCSVIFQWFDTLCAAQTSWEACRLDPVCVCVCECQLKLMTLERLAL